MIEVENLYKSYGTKEIFKNQSITLDNHCIYALVGVNGIGKSTFLNAITQPYLLDKGVVKIDGIYSSEFQAKYHYAFVPDTKEMFLNLTGKEYLDFVCGLYNQRERCTVYFRLYNKFKIRKFIGYDYSNLFTRNEAKNIFDRRIDF